MSVCITLEDDIDISRGDMLVREHNQPEIGQEMDLMICWMNSKKLIVRGKYTIKHTSQTARCIIKEVRYKYPSYIPPYTIYSHITVITFVITHSSIRCIFCLLISISGFR